MEGLPERLKAFFSVEFRTGARIFEVFDSRGGPPFYYGRAMTLAAIHDSIDAFFAEGKDHV